MISQLTALLVALAALYQAHRTGSKLEAERGLLQAEAKKEGIDGAGSLAEIALSLLVPLKEELAEQKEQLAEQRRVGREQAEQIVALTKTCADQEARIDSVERENSELRTGVGILSEQVRELGHPPRYTPPARRKGDRQ